MSAFLQNSKDALIRLREISVQDFQAFGVGHIGYIRPVISQGRKAYGLYGADGRLLALGETLGATEFQARDSGLEPLPVQ